MNAISKDLSFDKTVTVACALLVYVMGLFQVSDLMGIKRPLEVLLYTPILLYFFLRLTNFSFQRHFNPILGLILLMAGLKIYYGDNFLLLFDLLFSLTSVFALLSVSRPNIVIGAKWIVGIACFFSVLALIQFFIFLIFPELIIHTQIGLLDDGTLTTIDKNNGPAVIESLHPIAFLGLMTNERLNILGHEITRMRSFTTEPSLLVLYFLFPGAMGLFLHNKVWKRCSIVIILFCIFSFSGSVQASIVFAVIYFVASYFFSIRFIFLTFPVIIMGAILFILLTTGLGIFTAFDADLGTSGSTEFLSKGNSLIVRGNGIIFGANEAFHSPFGSSYQRELPLPILLSCMISAGWTGAVLILVFFAKLIKRLDQKLRHMDSNLNRKMAAAMLFGTLCTIFLFNDYQMLNYAGLILLIFIYRLLEPDDFVKLLPQ